MTEADSTKSLLARVRAVALDVDGVLTDGGLWWGPNGEEWKRFCFAHIMGAPRWTRTGPHLRRRQPSRRPLRAKAAHTPCYQGLPRQSRRTARLRIVSQ